MITASGCVDGGERRDISLGEWNDYRLKLQPTKFASHYFMGSAGTPIIAVLSIRSFPAAALKYHGYRSGVRIPSASAQDGDAGYHRVITDVLLRREEVIQQWPGIGRVSSPQDRLGGGVAAGWVGPSSAEGTTGLGEPSESDAALDAGIKALGNPLPAAGPAVAGFRRRGRRPIKLEQTKEKMRRDILEGRQKPTSLNDMLEKNLASTYGVSREIARKARNAVLSEFGENSNSRQIGTNDK